jgi:hypothetical protein
MPATAGDALSGALRTYFGNSEKDWRNARGHTTTESRRSGPGAAFPRKYSASSKSRRSGRTDTQSAAGPGAGLEYRDRHAIRGADLRAALDEGGKVYAYARWTRASARWHVVSIAPSHLGRRPPTAATRPPSASCSALRHLSPLRHVPALGHTLKDPKHGGAWGLWPPCGQDLTFVVRVLVAPSNAGDTAVFVSNNLDAAVACINVIITLRAAIPIPIRSIVTRTIIVVWPHAYTDATGTRTDIHSLRACRN